VGYNILAMLSIIRRRSLRTKIIAWSFVPTAIILIAVALTTLNAYQRVTENLVIDRNKKLTDLLARQLSREMTEDIDLITLVARNLDFYANNPGAQQIILGRVNDIVNLRIGESGQAYIIDGSGRLIYHSDSKLIGRDFSGQIVVQRILSGSIGTIRTLETGAFRTRDSGNREIIATYSVISGTSLVFVVEESWDELIRSSQRDRQFLVLLLALGIVVPVLVVAVGVRRITNPIADLISAAQEMAGGNFDRRISASTGDEIEDLAEQFNLMAQQLQASYTNLEQRVVERTKEIEIVNAIGLTISSTLNLDTVLQSIHDHVSRLMGLPDFFYIASYKPESQKVFFEFYLEKGAVVTQLQGQSMDKGGLLGWIIDTGQSLVIHDFNRDKHNLPVDPLFTHKTIVNWQGSWVGIPLKLQDRVTGVISVQSFRPYAFTERHIQMFSAIANQAAVAIENARLYERARQLAVMEERNRLARDLHDSVTQSLYGVTLYAEAAARLLASGMVEVATEHLYELRNTAQEALREMRLLIFELRPPLLQKDGLVAALEARLETVEGRAGLETEFKVSLQDQLPPEVEEGLYRIAQEALNNTLRHAQASRIAVLLHQDQDNVSLQIKDDGVGFDPILAREKGGLGLCGMEERAAQLCSSLIIDSKPGEGTCIRIVIPCSGYRNN